MATTLTYTPTGHLQILIAPTECGCAHAHPSSLSDWDAIIQKVGGWLAENAPTCRRFQGVEPWARSGAPARRVIRSNEPERAPEAASNKRPRLSSAQPQRPEPSAKPSPAPLLPTPTTASTSLPPILDDEPPSSKSGKPIRSAFGCGACKQRKIKCDEQRPTCANCKSSARKKERRCVYPYDLVLAKQGSERPASPVTETLAAMDTVVAETPVLNSSPPGASETQSTPNLPTPQWTSLRLPLQTSSESEPDSAALAQLVDTHGLTWFVDASEVVEKQVLSSHQRRAFTEYRQAVLEQCWNAYLGHHGKLSISLPRTPAHQPIRPSARSALAAETEGGGETLATLSRDALLYAFVSVGASHYAYWSKKRGMPYDEHLKGGSLMAQLSLDAIMRVLALREAQPRGTTEDIDAKVLMTLDMQVMYRIIAADPLGVDMLRLECEMVIELGGPSQMIDEPTASGALGPSLGMEAIPVVVNDVIRALIRGESTILPPDTEWLDEHPLAHRFIPEGYGFSMPMVKYMIETVSILYGTGRPAPGRLKTLYRTLTSTSLVEIYASSQAPRVQFGDLLMRQALLCLIYLDGFSLGPEDTQVIAASDAILELFAEAVWGNVYTVRWMLPLLVGGSVARSASKKGTGSSSKGDKDKDRRAAVHSVFDAMADTCGCHDIEAARGLMEKMWSRRDEGKTWRPADVIRDHKEMDLVYI